MPTATTSLGDLARANPAATRVFLRNRFDFWCNGRRSLADACAARGLDPAAILIEIDQETRDDDARSGWDARSPTELADHIETHYHAALRRDLPVLIAAAREVEQRHAAEPAVPVGLADVLAELDAELRRHMAKEEQILFPMIRRGARGQAVYMPVKVMESEHEAHSRRLATLRERTGGFALPAQASATWTALYHGLATLAAELVQHIHLENNILFSRVTREG